MPVRRERRGAIEVVTLDRPEALNALDRATIDDLATTFDDLEVDETVRVIVLTGTGERAFCVGADLREGSAAKGVPLGELGAFGRVVRRRSSKPVIAAVNGLALGGGFELVLASDLVVAADTATFGLPEVTVGIFACAGGVVRLAQRLPTPVALEFVLTGRPVTARRAYELGIVNSVVPRAEVLDAAIALGEVVAANAPLAVRACRQLTREVIGLPEEDAWLRNAEEMRHVLASEDALEGAKAFVEKRPPHWKGR